jgi:hypothetical protein
MKPGPLQYRTELVELVARQAPSNSIRRACIEGKVEVFGGFQVLPCSMYPGWILKITSRRQRTWLVAIFADDIHHKYRVSLCGYVPWKNWVGPRKGVTEYDIYAGDHPDQYQMLRDGGQPQ